MTIPGDTDCMREGRQLKNSLGKAPGPNAAMQQSAFYPQFGQNFALPRGLANIA
jgi:hypothetical protein